MSDMYRDSIFWVEVERIKPNPFQPRREFDQAKLQELAESIRMYGLLQPLTVTKKETPRDDGGISVEYELIAGERRLRASKLAGIQQLPVIIRTGENSDREKLELAIIENLQREDLNPVDRARAFHDLHKKFGFTHIEIGKKMGKSREYVSNTLRLLSLPEAILTYIAEGRITEGHTRPLMMLNSRPDEQTVLAKEILLKRLTVRESEAIARRAAQDRVTERHKIDPMIISVERALTERLGTRVTIEPREVGGRLVISFFNAQDLQALLDSMSIEDERLVVTDVFNGTSAADVAAVESAINQPLEDEVPAGADLADESTVFEQAVEEEVGAEAPVEDVVVVASEVVTADEVAEPEEIEVPEAPQGEVGQEKETSSVFDSILRSLSGREGEVSTQPGNSDDVEIAEPAEPAPATTVPEQTMQATVVPSADLPLPESAPEPTPEPTAQKQEDDTELYSIRNFSI